MKLKLVKMNYCHVVTDIYWEALPIITLEDGREFFIATTSEVAGIIARQYWENLAYNHPVEFAHRVGEKNLIAWALGKPAGPIGNKVTSLHGWLDSWINTPEKFWAEYDERERHCRINRNLARELDFRAYERNNFRGVCYRLK